nr:zinc finger, CCHC-type [Tanacetum cinerariifolium]
TLQSNETYIKEPINGDEGSLTNSLDTKNHLKIRTTFLSGQPGRHYLCINSTHDQKTKLDKTQTTWEPLVGRTNEVKDKENYLEHPILAAHVAAPGQQVPPQALVTHAAWVNGSKEIVALMLITMDLDIQQILTHLGQSVSSYVLKMKSYIDNLERLGQPVSLCLAVSLILVSLSKEYDGFVQNYNMHSMGKIVNELHAMLKLHEQTLPKKDAAPALHALRAGMVQKNQKKKPQKAAKGNQRKKNANMGFAHVLAPYFSPKPKNPPPPKKENHAKDAIYHQCGEVGHWRRNYPVFLTELLKKKKLSQGASNLGIFTIKFYSFPSTSWVYDTGCGTHIYITTQGPRGSRKLKPRALSLYMSDGHHATVKAIGEFHLCLPSGLVLILHNCNFAPSITRGIISVSRLYDNGFVNRFDGNVLSVSRNNLVYFSAIQGMEVENQLGKTIKSLRFGREGECMSQEFLDHLKEHVIITHRTPPYMPQYNGYPKKTIGYSFYYPLENKVFVARNAEFFENSLITQKASESLEDLEIIQEEESLEDLEIIQEEDTTRRSPNRMCLHVDVEEHELRDLGEPANYKAALLDPESDKWLNDMNVEMQSMKDNDWNLVDLPPNGKTVGSK